jgi:hypothetical protein
MDPASRSTPNGRGLNVRRFASEKPNLKAKRTKSPYLIPHVLRLPVALSACIPCFRLESMSFGVMSALALLKRTAS